MTSNEEDSFVFSCVSEEGIELLCVLPERLVFCEEVGADFVFLGSFDGGWIKRGFAAGW